MLTAIPAFFGTIFSIRRLFSKKGDFGFISEEFFSKDFVGKGICDIGGFGVTAKVISGYYNKDKSKDIHASIILLKELPVDMGWHNDFDGSTVYSIPHVDAGYSRNFLRYSYSTNRNLRFLISIDMFSYYEYPLNAMPNMPLIIWIRDPKGEVELSKIGTIECEITANDMDHPEELCSYAREEREFFRKVHDKSRLFQRSIIFAFNAKYLIPRAKRLYGLTEINPVFLPNPIYYPDYSKIKKSVKPTVCLLGRIDPVKRPWIFFELAKRFKDVDFLVCGQPSYPEIMNPIIEKYKSVENLKFVGVVDGEQKADMLSKLWVLVNTSIHEGLPCTFLEAFAYGTPVLSSVNPDDLVSQFGIYTGDNPGDGLDDKTLGEFQVGLETLLSDKAKLKKLGDEAREHVEKIYNFENFEKRLKDIVSNGFKKNYSL
ncbi:glycosyltransferase family 4 protein [Candidatus Omnitrophota bacterium]